MPDPYLDAIMAMGGPSRFQQFESFMSFLVRRRWRGYRVEKTADREGLFDLLVYQHGDEGALVAQVECKASRMDEVRAQRSLRSLISSWKLTTLAQRVKKTASGARPPISIIATTAPISKRVWDGYRKPAALRDAELWDANFLAMKLHADPILASFIGVQLPTSDPLVREYSLDLMIHEPRLFPDIPFRQIISEDVGEECAFDRPVFLFGPPNVGKTCWGLRQAWAWSVRKGPTSAAFFLNASHGAAPEHLVQISSRLSSESPLFFAIDDIHFASQDIPKWVEAVSVVETGREGPVAILWIGRDEAIAVSLKASEASHLDIKPFPVERVVDLFTQRLTLFLPWQRVIAALETRLNPRVARGLRHWAPPTRSSHTEEPYNEFVTWLSVRLHRDIELRLANTERQVGSASYDVYLKMLAFGSLGCEVETSFLRDVGVDSTLSIEHLVEVGLAVRSPAGRTLALTEHPFQVCQVLDALTQLPESVRARSWTESRSLHLSAEVRIPEALLALYVFEGNEADARSRIERLANHAEWSGVREPLSRALQLLLDCDDWRPGGDLRSIATTWYRKLARTSYPKDEVEFLAVLDKDGQHWAGEERIARESAEQQAGTTRLDTILYERAYIQYLREQYCDAADLFRASVAAGLGAIATAEQSSLAASQERGLFALGHIWIAGVLERSADLRRCLADGLSTGSLSPDATRLIEEIAQIHAALAAANLARPSDAPSAFAQALTCLDPSWSYRPVAVAERVSEIQGPLRRHERNAWLHALETSCWPKLFGLADDRIRTSVPSPSTAEYELTLATPAPRVGLPAYYYLANQLLFEWAEGRAGANHAERVVAACALVRAGGGFEYLGDMMLLAWRCAPSGTRDAIAWYLRHRIPDVGFNHLPKLALDQQLSRAESIVSPR